MDNDSKVQGTNLKQNGRYQVTFDGFDLVWPSSDSQDQDAYWSLPPSFLGNIVSTVFIAPFAHPFRQGFRLCVRS